MSEPVNDPIPNETVIEKTAETPVTQEPTTKFNQYESKNVRPVIPEGMSKSQWKKQQKRLRLEEQKATFQQIRKEKKIKKKAQRRAQIDEYKARGEEIPASLLRSKPPKEQTHNGGAIIMDCSFDDLMNEKEMISLSNQITRAYSAVRFAPIISTLKITSFNKTLKKRFDEVLVKSGYLNWKNVEFIEEEFTVEDPSKFIYLSADSDDVLEELDPSITYIVGGIVDKNRHKNICKNKADELGIKTARLPITQYINLSGRTVLTTGHVIEIMLKWYESKDWKQAFEAVLPSRKIASDEAETTSVEPEEEVTAEPEENPTEQ